MTSRTTKAKKRAVLGVSGQALIEAGLLDPFFHLQDSMENRERCKRLQQRLLSSTRREG
jgi:hypothetical protein